MLPIIGAVIGAVVSVVGLYKKFLEKKVYIYGMKAAGKTTFFKYCHKEKVVDQYIPTYRLEEYRKWLKGWIFYDTPGQDYNHKDLKEQEKAIKKATKVLYFFRADELADPNTRKVALRTIKSNVLQFEKDLEGKLILVGTHIDLIFNFSPSMPEQEWEKDKELQRCIQLACNHQIEYVSFLPDYIDGSTKIILDLIKE